MRVEVRKREITDVTTMGKLVAEHVDGIEPGLSVIDSRLLLGHSTVDLVAQDGNGALVLIALGFRGDEGMLLRMVDAYSWCVEYPESVQRHYPSLAVSESRPPRVVFVMTRVPESFQRKVKQLSFPSVDAVEIHYIDVDGVPAVYFDSVAQIRRAPHGVAEPVVRPAAPVIAAPVVPEPVRVAVDSVDPGEASRLVSVLAARLAADGGGSRVQPSVVETPVRIATPARPEPSVVVSTTQIAAAGEPAAAPVAMPVIAGSSDARHGRGGVSLASAMCHVIDGSARVVGEDAGAVAVAELDEPVTEPIAAVDATVEVVEPIAMMETPAEIDEPAVETPVVEAEAAAVEPAPVVEAAPEPVVDAPVAAAGPVEAQPAAPKAPDADPNQKYPFSEAARAAQLAQDLGIQLPKEGALTRQWIDFLNQLAAK